MKIGAHALRNALFVAPMAGITDRPFRRLARRFGAALAVSEMVSARPELRDSRKSRLRVDHAGEEGPVSVQIAGSEPQELAEAARHNAGLGADIIDINMGCPAKKICNVYAGSALLKDEPLVARIIDAVVKAVHVPVTLKIRTGWNKDNRNALVIAKIAEDHGIQSLAMHGRTRACMYMGDAEYDTIRAVKQAVRIPVVANGDVTTPEKAKFVLEYTGADAVMIGRAAQGRPWIFREIEYFLQTGMKLAPPPVEEIRDVLVGHLHDLYAFYGYERGARVARKHIGWYTKGLRNSAVFRARMNTLDAAETQLAAVKEFFDGLLAHSSELEYAEEEEVALAA